MATVGVKGLKGKDDAVRGRSSPAEEEAKFVSQRRALSWMKLRNWQ